MKQVVICSSNITRLMPNNETIKTIQIDEYPVTIALIETDEINFDAKDPQNKNKVLVRKRAFSCNYRDKAIIFSAAVKSQESQNSEKAFYFPVGSDFVAEVVSVGSAVEQLKPGDRVIPNSSYPHAVPGTLPGIPSNSASRQYDIFHCAKLMKIPDEMSDDVAASFTIGAITSACIVRKLDIQPDSNVLVTASKSNTSLFAISTLREKGANVYAVSTSNQFERELANLGLKELIICSPADLSKNHIIKQLAREINGFNYVIDPFTDLYLDKVLDFMAFDGKYISCGSFDQYSKIIDRPFLHGSKNINELMDSIIMKNLQINGNCLGSTQDLQRAINEYVSGNLTIPIDSVHCGSNINEFFDRTYNAKDRFGKVVYKY